MASLAFDRFYGVIPREHPSNLEGGYAQVAHDVRLDNGLIRTWRQPKLIKASSAATKTVHLLDCCWYAWDKCVDVAEGRPDCKRLYVTGSTDYPVVGLVADDCSISWQRLGLPNPSKALTTIVSPAPTDSETLFDTSYVYTYVNNLEEESAPSIASTRLRVNEGSVVTVTGFQAPPAVWKVEKIRLYRASTGFYEGSEKAQINHTSFLLIAEIRLPVTVYSDNLNNSKLGPANDTEQTMPPPEGLVGIVSAYGGTTMAGFVAGNELRFSRLGEAWNWPEIYRMSLDDNIVSLEASPDGFIHVITDGSPYAVQAEQPPDEKRCREVTRHAEKLPGVVCCSGRGSISTPHGTFYVSHYGLVQMVGNQRPRVITMPWYGYDDWRRMKPETMRLGYYSGVVFCISDSDGFILTVDNQTFAKSDTFMLSTISDRPKAFFMGRNGELFLLHDDAIFQWNAGAQARPYIWKSREVEFPGYMNLSAGRLRFDKGFVDMRLFASGREVQARRITAGVIFRLLRYGHHIFHSVELRGTGEVSRVHLATSAMELLESARSR